MALCLLSLPVESAAQAAPATVVRAIRPILTPDMTRLVIELSAPAAYRLRAMEGQPRFGTPERLRVEILDTTVDPRLTDLRLHEGPVVRARASQASPRIARLVLDAPGMTAYGGFWMDDPPRLIIDIRGPARTTSARPAPTRPDSSAAPPTITPERRGAAPTPVLPTAAERQPREPREPQMTPTPTRRFQVAREPRVTPTPTRRFKVVLDPGHGGKDVGAIGVGGVQEKDVVLAIALLLKSRLAADPRFDVVLTRQTDIYLRLEERTARANTEDADLFVSIHANASPNPEAHGVETYFLNNTNDRATLRLAAMENGLRNATTQVSDDHPASLILSDLIQNFKVEQSMHLAQHVQRSLMNTLAAGSYTTRDLGVKRGPFYVLVGAGMPCVLAEVSFLTHSREGALLARRAYQEAIADGLLRGIGQFVENAATMGNL